MEHGFDVSISSTAYLQPPPLDAEQSDGALDGDELIVEARRKA